MWLWTEWPIPCCHCRWHSLVSSDILTMKNHRWTLQWPKADVCWWTGPWWQQPIRRLHQNRSEDYIKIIWFWAALQTRQQDQAPGASMTWCRPSGLPESSCPHMPKYCKKAQSSFLIPTTTWGSLCPLGVPFHDCMKNKPKYILMHNLCQYIYSCHPKNQELEDAKETL